MTQKIESYLFLLGGVLSILGGPQAQYVDKDNLELLIVTIDRCTTSLEVGVSPT